MARFPFVKQKDSMQCGIACLASICEYYGEKYSTQFISRICSGTSTGVSLQALNNWDLTLCVYEYLKNQSWNVIYLAYYIGIKIISLFYIRWMQIGRDITYAIQAKGS